CIYEAYFPALARALLARTTARSASLTIPLRSGMRRSNVPRRPLSFLCLFLEHLCKLPSRERDRGPAGIVSDLDDQLDDRLPAEADLESAAIVSVIACW